MRIGKAYFGGVEVSKMYLGSDLVYQREVPEEPSVINLLLSSQNFTDNTNWLTNGIVFTANAATAPDGTITATRVREAASVMDFYSLFQDRGFGLDKALTYSIHAKKETRGFLELCQRNARTGAVFNLTTGIASNVSAGVTAVVVDAGNGWFRCGVSYTQAYATDNMDIYMEATAGVQDYVGNGTSSILIWGAQLEESATMGAYDPT